MGVGGNEGAVGPGNLPRGCPLQAFGSGPGRPLLLTVSMLTWLLVGRGLIPGGPRTGSRPVAVGCAGTPVSGLLPATCSFFFGGKTRIVDSLLRQLFFF